MIETQNIITCSRAEQRPRRVTTLLYSVWDARLGDWGSSSICWHWPEHPAARKKSIITSKCTCTFMFYSSRRSRAEGRHIGIIHDMSLSVKAIALPIPMPMPRPVAFGASGNPLFDPIRSGPIRSIPHCKLAPLQLQVHSFDSKTNCLRLHYCTLN